MLETAKQRRAAEQALFEEAEQLEPKRKAHATKNVEVSSAAQEKLQCENSIAKARETMQHGPKDKSPVRHLEAGGLECRLRDETIVNAAAQHWHNLFMNISFFLKFYATSSESKNIKN